MRFHDHETAFRQAAARLSKRDFLMRLGSGIGAIGLAGVMDQARGRNIVSAASPLSPSPPHFAPRAKRVIQLFMPGGPSQVDTFDYKPLLAKHAGERPALVDRKSLRNTKNGLMPSPFAFKPYGQSGKWVSDIFPHVGECVDDISFIHSMHTDIPEHAGAMMMMNVGALQPNRPSLGSWLVYGLGTENQNLPGFVAMSPRAQPRCTLANWGNAFLPGACAGSYVNIAAMTPEAVMHNLQNTHLTPTAQREQIDLLRQLNQTHLERRQYDHELEAGIAAMEMAFRMQRSIPDLVDLSNEPAHILDLYGPDVKRTGSFTHSALLARRMLERGVRAVQILHRGWDQHDNLPTALGNQCKDTDQATAALVIDLKRRGLLEDTLVVWGGEFGRTVYSQGTLTSETYGRDHHPRNFCMWMAGGGVKGGIVHGATDDFSYNIVKDPVHLNSINATILQCMGIDHSRFSQKFQGLDQRLTGVEQVDPVHAILA